MPMRQFSYNLSGIASDVGTVVPIDEWAKVMQVPHRSKPGKVLSGADIHRILGIDSKCWEPDRFANFETVCKVAQEALRSACLRASEIEAVFTVTCTPYEVMLDQDVFRLFRGIGIPDHVAPVQLGAGCAGLARAGTVVQQMNVDHALVVTYNVPSLFTNRDGSPNPLYLHNDKHPLRDLLWASPAIFSDGAAAMVFSRDPEADGFVSYSRDSQSFDGGPGFEAPLITYEGGGAALPPGAPGVPEMSCFAMQGDEVRKYYTAGMLLNHAAMCEARSDYATSVKRIYPHQAGPVLLREFVEGAGLSPQRVAKKVETYGNLVSVSTPRLIHEDLVNGVTRDGDEVCIMVVGAGPERGGLYFRLRVREIVPARTSQRMGGRPGGTDGQRLGEPSGRTTA
jgi:3-oxoacyl-[acyl-carrier-protein] synthase-3